MNATRLWAFGSIALIVALLVSTWFVGISPRLAESARANSDREAVELQNATQAISLASLKDQFENLGALEKDLADVRLAIPSDAELSNFIRQLNAAAVNSGVIITELAINDAELYAAPEVPPTDAELAGAVQSVNPDNFVTVTFTGTIIGTHAAAMDFMKAMQTGERLALVHDLEFPNGIVAADAGTEMLFTGQIFVLRDAPAVLTPPSETPGAETPASQVTPE